MSPKKEEYGGYLSINSFLEAPNQEFIALAEAIDRINGGEVIEVIASNLRPVRVLEIKKHREQLVSQATIQGSSGIVATDNHSVLTVKQESDTKFYFEHVMLSDLTEDDRIMTSPSITDNSLRFAMSEFVGLRALGLEDVYEVVVDTDDKGNRVDGILINGLVSLQPKPSDEGIVVAGIALAGQDSDEGAAVFDAGSLPDLSILDDELE